MMSNAELCHQPPRKLRGTLREREPSHTWELVRDRIADYGISRVADLTGLDVIGLPVWMAVRPLATTLGVSLGKGATDDLARLSAVMEALEISVSETFFRSATPIVATANDLQLGYDVADLTPTNLSIVSADFALPWIDATSIVDGAPSFVPLRSAAIDAVAGGGWSPVTLFSTGNGLASGNSVPEASVHALFEVIERYSTAHMAELTISDRRVLDLDSIPDGWLSDLVQRMLANGFWIEIVDCTRIAGVPAFASFLWSADMPGIYAGSGSHLLAEVAMQRALTEAIQSRLSVISGTREDIGSIAYRGVRTSDPPQHVPPSIEFGDLVPPIIDPTTTSNSDLILQLSELVTSVTSRPVFRIDMAPPGEPFAVCKVIAPGLVESSHEATEELPRRNEPDGETALAAGGGV